VLLEILLFVPASVLLGVNTVAPLLLLLGRFGLTIDDSHQIWFYSLFGIASYGFPFAGIRRFVTRIQLSMLKGMHRLPGLNPAEKISRG
jgi:hypothetical protein